jgi:hypothetical protein
MDDRTCAWYRALVQIAVIATLEIGCPDAGGTEKCATLSLVSGE